MIPTKHSVALYLLLAAKAVVLQGAETNHAAAPGIKKIRDIVVYQDNRFYCSFPSIVKRPNGELLVAFRRAPDRRPFGVKGVTHTDANSYLVLVRSRDHGTLWSSEPELIFANPFGGSQDPCMIQLSDHSLLCSSYGWSPFSAESIQQMNGVSHLGNWVMLGGYLVRSADGGNTWLGPIVPPPVQGETRLDIFGKPLPAFNRGAMCEGKSGRLYWVTAGRNPAKPSLPMTHLMISDDKGLTWKYACPVARDDKAGFNETSIYETPKGDLMAFMRTEGLADHTVVARSKDGGKSFEPWEDSGFMGHPHYALRLPDQRVLLVYGYRHAPFGIRARVLDAECADFKTAPEIILRDDGGSGDLGYPWATMLNKHRALVVYYFNQRADGPRFIAGTELEIP